jgi:hypothetical protein
MKSVRIAVAAALLATSGAGLAYKAGTTREQVIASVQRKFTQMDTDRSNSVSLAELQAFMDRAGAKRGEAPDPAKAARRMRRLDTDTNGSVSLAELQAEEMEKFARADADGNGKIEGAEADPA